MHKMTEYENLFKTSTEQSKVWPYAQCNTFWSKSVTQFKEHIEAKILLFHHTSIAISHSFTKYMTTPSPRLSSYTCPTGDGYGSGGTYVCHSFNKMFESPHNIIVNTSVLQWSVLPIQTIPWTAVYVIKYRKKQHNLVPCDTLVLWDMWQIL